ncbi:MAG: response regulator [Acidobacteria bacterium]|nr:response regulator [Acidobacteriota bacterium]
MARDLKSGHTQVLVVEPDEMTREDIAAYFVERGVPVSTAPDGRAAISTLLRSGGRYTVVVTELNLTGADGFAVLHAARQANRHCLVMLLTAGASLDSAVLGVRVGAADYLLKPFGMAQFDTVYKRMVERGSETSAVAMVADAGRPLALPAPAAAPAAPGGAAMSMEQRLARMETLLGRIESRLEAVPVAARR